MCHKAIHVFLLIMEFTSLFCFSNRCYEAISLLNILFQVLTKISVGDFTIFISKPDSSSKFWGFASLRFPGRWFLIFYFYCLCLNEKGWKDLQQIFVIILEFVFITFHSHRVLALPLRCCITLEISWGSLCLISVTCEMYKTLLYRIVVRNKWTPMKNLV